MATLDIIGCGGFAAQIAPLLERGRHLGDPVDGDGVRFIDDAGAAYDFLGYPVAAFDATTAGDAYLVSVADPATRRRLVARCRDRDLRATSLTASTALVASGVVVGEGAILYDHVVIEPGVRIGEHFHANLFAFVAHECVIGDFVTFAPRVTCNGRVTVENDVFVGAGAIIRQGVSIGAGATVGMGAVVTGDVPPGVTVVGNPARPLER